MPRARTEEKAILKQLMDGGPVEIEGSTLESTENRTEASPKLAKKKRTPVGGARDILTVKNPDPNYVYRWVLDAPGRLGRFREGGYEEVTADLEVGQNTVDRGSKLGSVITKSSGGGQTLVLMRIPKEWYDEDQKTKQDAIDDLEDTMRGPGDKADYGSVAITQGRKTRAR